MNSREIVYIVRMRNESREAIRQLAADLRDLNAAMGGAGAQRQRPGGAGGGSGGGGGGRGIPGLPGIPALPGGGGGGGQGGIPGVGDPTEFAGGMNTVVASLRMGAAGFLGFAGAIAGVSLAGLGIKEVLGGIVQAGDAAAMAIGRLNAQIGSRDIAVDTYDQLAATAQRIGISTDAAVDSFLRFNLAAQQMGKNRQEAMRFSETVQKIAIISGASGAEASASFLQLGQALASGRLQGDELRSILEQMPQLALLLANELKVPIGRLRELGSEGKLTSGVVFSAVLKAGAQVNSQFAQMPLTVERASMQMQAGFQALGRRINEQTGLTDALARALQALGLAAQSAADKMAPKTLMDRLKEAQERYAAMTRSAEELMRMEADRLKAQNEQDRRNNAARFGPMQTARNAGPGPGGMQLQDGQTVIGNSPAEMQTPAQRAAEELAAVQALADEYTNLVGTLGHVEQISQLRAQAAKRRSDASEAEGVALQTLGLKNDEVSTAIEKLTLITKAGEQAMVLFGMSASRAGALIQALQERIDPLVKVMAELKREAADLEAAGGGRVNVEIQRRIREVYGNQPPPRNEQEAEARQQGELEIRRQVLANLARAQANENRETARTIQLEDQLATARRTRNVVEAARIAGQIREAQVLRDTGSREQAQEAGRLAAQRERLSLLQGEAGRYQLLSEVRKEALQQIETAREAYESEARGQQLSAAATAARAAALKVARDGTVAYQAAYKELLPLFEQEQGFIARREGLAAVRTINQETAALREEYRILTTVNDERQRALELERARIRARLIAQNRPVDAQAVDAEAGAAMQRRQEDFNVQAQRSIRDRVAGLRDEISLIGLSGDALERRRLIVSLEADARKQGLVLGAEEIRLAEEQLALIQKQRAARQGDPLGGMKSGLDKFLDQTKDVFSQVEEATVRMANGMTDALTEFAMTGKMSFSDFASSVIRDLLRIAIQQAVVRPILGAASGILGGVNTGLGSFLSSVFGGIFHDGGVVGDDQRSRAMKMDAFAVAPRFHVGGLITEVGIGPMQRAAETFRHAERFHSGGLPSVARGSRQRLGADEVPIIAQKGEVIFPTVRTKGTRGVRMLVEGGEAVVPVMRLRDGRMGLDARAVTRQLIDVQNETRARADGGSRGGDARSVRQQVLNDARRYHTGGIVQEFHRASNDNLFRTAPRFHSGGMPGLGAGEVPMVAKRGEAVFPTVRLPDGSFGIRGVGGSGGAVFAPNITVNVNGGRQGDGGAAGGNPLSDQRFGEMVARLVRDGVRSEMTEFLTEQQRSGGMLKPVATL